MTKTMGNFTIPPKAWVWAATISVVVAIALRLQWPTEKKLFSYILVGAWTLVPPIWFLYDWCKFEPKDASNFEHFKYSQELARNIWLALIVVLAAITGVTLRLE